MKNEIFSKIDKYLDYAIALQTGLTARPAMCPSVGGEGEYDKAVWLEKELKKLKFDEISRLDAPHKEAKHGIRPNIIAKYYGKDRSRTLWIMSHMDVVPPGELKLWKTDPYKLVRKGDRIYGRGTEDNQQGLVSSILCAKALMETGTRPPVNLGLLFNADEETASKYGAEYVMKRGAKLFGKNDIFIVPDGGEPDGKMVEVAEKSLLWLKFHTTGKQCHASTPADGNNSFRIGSELVVALNSLYKKFNRKNSLFLEPSSTFEPTKKDNNVPNINTIPGDDVFYLDCRILPEYGVDAVLKEVRKIAAAVAKKHRAKIDVEIVQRGGSAPATRPDSEIVRLVMNGIKEVYGTTAKPRGIGGNTVAVYFRLAGFDTVVYSRLDHMAHQPNEYCILGNLIGDAKVFASVAMNAGDK